ncbi:MAG: crosslink repair DNA glycosylase YcaQ family protein [Thermomicrobiales bacterium]
MRLRRIWPVSPRCATSCRLPLVRARTACTSRCIGGDICFGPSRDGAATFRALAGDPLWPSLPDVDTAGRRAIALYLGSYGPATAENLGSWINDGLGVPRRRLLGWLAGLGETVSTVLVDGAPAYAMTPDLDQLAATESSNLVRLLPGFDPWVLGPGTADARIVDPHRRALVTRGANLVLWCGVVSGTWRVRGPVLTIVWFSERGSPPIAALEDEVVRIAALHARSLTLGPIEVQERLAVLRSSGCVARQRPAQGFDIPQAGR